MLDAVYIDLLANRTIAGLLTKPAFYTLFETLKQKSDSNVMVFNPGEVANRGLLKQKGNAPFTLGREMVGLVETGEAWSLPEYILNLFNYTPNRF